MLRVSKFHVSAWLRRLHAQRLGLAAVLLLVGVGCAGDAVPVLNGDYPNLRETVRAYHEYLDLEARGVETVRLRTGPMELTLSLPNYLFYIAQAFERWGKEDNAEKLYLRLLLHYPLLDNESQLGIRTDNRLLWLLSDKPWIVPTRAELVSRLETALEKRDLYTLAQLISHDFSFGKEEGDRLAVNYLEGLKFIAYNLQEVRHLNVEVLEQPNAPDQALLKASGWDGGRTWYFSLRRSVRPAGWEWFAASWNEEDAVAPEP